MKRVCTKCKRKLDETEFSWKLKNIRLSAHCKKCSRAYIKQHYINNTSYYIKKAIKRNERIKNETREYIGDYLSRNHCVDCGETNIIVLEFDHKDRDTKDGDVSLIARKYGSVEKLKKEIAKCEVRCANCHRIKTAKEVDSWKLKYAPVA